MKSINPILYFLFLATIICSCKEDYVEPQRYGNLTGTVLHEVDFSPIDNAEIKTSPAFTTLLSDATGSFSIENIPVGSYTLEIKKEGFKKELQTVLILDGQTTDISLLLTTDLIPNNAPSTPTNISPADLSEDLPTTVTLVWEASDLDADDELTYTVYFFKDGQNSQTPLALNITDTLLEVNDLEYDKTYHWQVIVSDGEASPVYSPVWTLSTIAYPEHRIRWARKVANKFQVFCADDDGTVVQMTDYPTSCWRPRLSPDRKQVAFLSNLGVEPHLYVMDFDGTNIKKLTTIPVAGVDLMEVDFCWSPNSAHLLYTNNDRLFSIQRDGNGLQLVALAPAGLQFASVDWTEQGNLKVVRLTGTNVYQSEIRLLDVNGNWSTLVEDQPGKTGNAMFSVDGSKILFTHDVSGFQNTEGRQLDSRIFLYDIATGTTTDLSVEKINGTNDLEPRFSPTGSQVIFTNTPNDGISTKNLMKVNLDGTLRTLIEGNAEMGDWL
jgi:TolB protein